MKTMIAGLLLLVFCLTFGCTVKMTGEASMMKQWDRPAESTVVSTVDTSSNARPDNVNTAQQGNVGKVK
jgi:hypothetical protein